MRLGRQTTVNLDGYLDRVERRFFFFGEDEELSIWIARDYWPAPLSIAHVHELLKELTS